MEQKDLYEKLRARRNEMLPEAMVLRWGCEVAPTTKYSDGREKGNRYFIIGEAVYPEEHKLNGYVRVAEQHHGAVVAEWGNGGLYTTDLFVHTDNIVPLGAPVTLREVVRMIEIARGKSNIWTMFFNGEVHGDEEELLCTFDLTKSPEDWDAETSQWILDVTK